MRALAILLLLACGTASEELSCPTTPLRSERCCDFEVSEVYCAGPFAFTCEADQRWRVTGPCPEIP